MEVCDFSRPSYFFQDVADGVHSAPAKYNAHDEPKLREWLGITKTGDPAKPQLDLVTASKKDPKSRFM